MRFRDARMALNREEAKNMVDPYRPAADILPDGAWRGERCFIIGGGPSLMGFDFECLRGRGRIIIINKGFIRVPFADVLFFMDHASFYISLKRGLFGPEAITAWGEFPGIKVFLNLRGRRVEDAYSVRSLGRRGLSTNLRRGLYHGNNSGYGAIEFAICMQANPIYLLGYDMKFLGAVTHWHGGYGHRQSETTVRSYRQELDGLAKLVAKTQFKVIYLNPESALAGFPKMDPKTVFTQ